MLFRSGGDDGEDDREPSVAAGFLLELRSLEEAFDAIRGVEHTVTLEGAARGAAIELSQALMAVELCGLHQETLGRVLLADEMHALYRQCIDEQSAVVLQCCFDDFAADAKKRHLEFLQQARDVLTQRAQNDEVTARDEVFAEYACSMTTLIEAYFVEVWMSGLRDNDRSSFRRS